MITYTCLRDILPTLSILRLLWRKMSSQRVFWPWLWSRQRRRPTKIQNFGGQNDSAGRCGVNSFERQVLQSDGAKKRLTAKRRRQGKKSIKDRTVLKTLVSKKATSTRTVFNWEKEPLKQCWSRPSATATNHNQSCESGIKCIVAIARLWKSKTKSPSVFTKC